MLDGTVAYVVQVLVVWLMSGLHKTGAEWWPDGTAVSMSLHLEAFATEFARVWRGYDSFAQPLTITVSGLSVWRRSWPWCRSSSAGWPVSAHSRRSRSGSG